MYGYLCIHIRQTGTPNGTSWQAAAKHFHPAVSRASDPFFPQFRHIRTLCLFVLRADDETRKLVTRGGGGHDSTCASLTIPVEGFGHDDQQFLKRNQQVGRYKLRRGPTACAQGPARCSSLHGLTKDEKSGPASANHLLPLHGDRDAPVVNSSLGI